MVLLYADLEQHEDHQRYARPSRSDVAGRDRQRFPATSAIPTSSPPRRGRVRRPHPHHDAAAWGLRLRLEATLSHQRRENAPPLSQRRVVHCAARRLLLAISSTRRHAHVRAQRRKQNPVDPAAHRVASPGIPANGGNHDAASSSSCGDVRCRRRVDCSRATTARGGRCHPRRAHETRPKRPDRLVARRIPMAKEVFAWRGRTLRDRLNATLHDRRRPLPSAGLEFRTT